MTSESPGQSGPDDAQFDAFSVDVHELLTRTEASLFSHLVTRPTGRAVRLAIEAQLEEVRRPVLSLVDFSSVAILDYSCADEVVARLVLMARERTLDTYLLFHGLQAHHLDPVEAVLARHSVRAILQPAGSGPRLVGPGSEVEARVWARVERSGRVPAHQVEEQVATTAEERRGLTELLEHRLVFRHPVQADLVSLATLSTELPPPPVPED